MAIVAERNDLETFSTNEVVSYLSSQLNTGDSHFEIVKKLKFCDAVMVKLDNVNFIIHAEKTYIELSFDKSHTFEMGKIFEAIRNWDKFSKTRKTFYVEIIENKSHTVFFGNWYASGLDYRKKFSRYKQFLITEFKHNFLTCIQRKNE